MKQVKTYKWEMQGEFIDGIGCDCCPSYYIYYWTCNNISNDRLFRAEDEFEAYLNSLLENGIDLQLMIGDPIWDLSLDEVESIAREYMVDVVFEGRV